ncbi:MAG TPA: PAS domain-containing protein, partial [Solimonas sp.]|nr:PAS domain-containing protein [Solimonas sp.]
MPDYASGRSRECLLLIGLGVLIGLSCWAGIALTQMGDRVASVWLANGLLTGILLRMPSQRWPPALLVGLGGNVIANLIAGDGTVLALGLALCNSVEVLIAVILLRRRLGPDCDLRQGPALAHFALVAIVLAPLCSSLLAAAMLAQANGQAMLSILAVWYPADALGMALVVPLVLALARPADSPPLRNWLLEAALLLLVAALVYGYGDDPLGFQFFSFPPLLLLAFRHGHRGAAIGVALLALVAIPGTLLHLQAGGAAAAPVRESIFLVQCYLACASALALALATLQQQRRDYGRELRKTAHLLRSVTDNLPAMIAYVGADRRFRFVNAGVAQLLGQPAQQLVGQLLPAEGPCMLPPEQVDAVLAGGVRSFEQVHQDGARLRHYDTRLVPDIDAQGRVQGFYALCTDISEHKLAEQQLARREQRLRMIADHLPAYIAYFDHEQRYRFANQRYRERLGIEPEAMMGRSVGEVFGEGMEADFAAPTATVQSGKPVRFEQRFSEFGRESHLLVDFVPDLDEQGQVQGFYSSALDITARKQAEIQQAASEERLRTITDNLPVVIAYVDEQRVYRFCNRTHEAWFGLGASVAVGRRLEEVLPPAVVESLRYYIDCALHGARSEGNCSVELSGQRRHVQVCCVPQQDARGTVRGLYLLLSDVTSAKRVEQQLQQLALYDPLTGLANRRELRTRLGAALNRIQRYGGSLSLLFIDVDHFKSINDSNGHAAGDEVLQELALRLRNSVRTTDTVARVAGDEFVVILEQLRSAEEPQFVARKLLAAIGKPFLLDTGPLTVGVSIGIAVGGNGDSIEHLMQRADRALYAAKAG